MDSGHGGFHANDGDHGVDGLVEGEVGGVDVEGIVGAGEGADGAGLIAHVAFDDLVEDIVEFRGDALGFELGDAAAGAFLGVGVEVELEVGAGEDNRSLVAALGDERALLLANLSLLTDEFLADPGVVGGDVGDLGDGGLPEEVGNVAVIEQEECGGAGEVEAEGKEAAALGDAVGVGEDVLFEGVEGDGAVHGAGIELRDAELTGQLKCGGGLSRTGWAIDGYNHEEASLGGRFGGYNNPGEAWSSRDFRR